MVTKINCCKCDKEIKGGYYNTPCGAFCAECYKKQPKKTRDRDLQKSLQEKINIAKSMQNILK